MIVWLCGLSGSGKTTIGREVYRRWKAIDPATAFIDGDEVRELLGLDRSDDHFRAAYRIEVSHRLADIAGWLDRQDINAVVCNISITASILERNRERFADYFEVFVHADPEVLFHREPDGLYARARAGIIGNVVGTDIDYEPPTSPDLRIDNTARIVPATELAEQVIAAAGIAAGSVR